MDCKKLLCFSLLCFSLLPGSPFSLSKTPSSSSFLSLQYIYFLICFWVAELYGVVWVSAGGGGHRHRHRVRRSGQSLGGGELSDSNPRKLFVFGDSYVDTGNNRKPAAKSWQYPYGITFPGKPTGRFSDGRVLTDYLGNSENLTVSLSLSVCLFFFSFFLCVYFEFI